MDDLVTWLRAQLDEDERVALAARKGASGWDGDGVWTTDDRDGAGQCRIEGDVITIYDEGGHTEAHAKHIARWDPARVLAEVDAKRRILDEHQPIVLTYWPTPMCGICADPDATPIDDPMGSDGPWTPNAAYPCPTVRLLALPHAGRDGWREEWRP